MTTNVTHPVSPPDQQLSLPVHGSAHLPVDVSWVRPDPSWRLDARCLDTDTESFFALTQREIDAAKRFCGGCSVRDLCLVDAVVTENTRPFGVRGGLSAVEREPLVSRVQNARLHDETRRRLAELGDVPDAACEALVSADDRGGLAAGVATETKRWLLRNGLASESVRVPTSRQERGAVRLNPAGRTLRAELLGAAS